MLERAWAFLLEHRTEILLGIAFTFFGLFLERLARLLERVYRHVRSPQRRMETLLGQWHVYHYTTRDGENIVRSEVWTISKRIGGLPRIQTQDPKMANLIYHGEVGSVTSHDVTCVMRGHLHEEEFYVRVLYPIPSDRNITQGIKVGVNFDHRVFSTIYLFSRAEMTDQLATSQLDALLESATDDKRFMKLTPDRPKSSGRRKKSKSG